MGRVSNRFGWQYLLYLSSIALLRHRWVREADVIQMYNIHAPANVDFLSHTVLPFLSRRKPLVWRLSDMWAFTGHCSYAYECQRWRTGCGHCPHLDVHPGLRRDTTAFLWRIKRQVYRRSRLVVVATSRWMAKLAAESPLLGRFPIHRIPNGVDTTTFRPIAKARARAELGIRAEGPVALLGAYEPRKGQAVVGRALADLARLRSGRGLAILTVGTQAPVIPDEMPRHHLGEITDDHRLALAYSAADVFVFPTLAENLPNMALESLACGVPVVTFDVGGMADAVRPGQTGYLAQPGDPFDLAQGVRHVLALEPAAASGLAHHCRAVAETEYSRSVELGHFLDLYRSLVLPGRPGELTGAAA